MNIDLAQKLYELWFACLGAAVMFGVLKVMGKI